MKKKEEGQIVLKLRVIQTYPLPNGGIIGSIARILTERETPLHRYGECIFRNECLMFADKQKFKSFSCSLCPHFKPKKK